METPAPFAVPHNARCIGCGYALYANTSQRCPECGREFDPFDRTTYDLGHSRGALKLLMCMLVCRMLIVILLVLSFITGGFRLETMSLALLLAAGLAVVLTLYFQTHTAGLLLGQSEALRYLFAALMLAPVWLIGPILVPSLVAIEVRQRVRDAGLMSQKP